MSIDLSSLPENIQHDILLLEPNVMFRCSPDVQEEAVTQDPQSFLQLDKPTLAAGLIAVGKDPALYRKFLRDFPDCDDYIKLKAVEAHPWNIESINNPSQEIVSRYLEKIAGEMFSDNPDNPASVILKALESDGAAIRFIENPTREMKLTALRWYPGSIQWMTDLDEEMQLLVADAPDLVCLMLDSLKITFSPKVKRLAKKTLLSNIKSAPHEMMVRKYSKALVLISSNAELLDMLRNPLFSPQLQTRDFALQPSDQVSKLMMMRDGFKAYFSHAIPDWKMSDELQAWVAQQQWHGEYGYDSLPEPCSRAKFAFAGAVAGIKFSGIAPPTKQVCLKAIDRCPLGGIHKVFECIPAPDKNVKIRYIERVAGAKRGSVDIPSVKTMRSAISRTDKANDSKMLIDAAASLDTDLDTAWVLAKTLSPGNEPAIVHGQIYAFFDMLTKTEKRKTVTSSAVEVDLSDIPLDIDDL